MGELRLLCKCRQPNELCNCAAFNCRFQDNNCRNSFACQQVRATYSLCVLFCAKLLTVSFALRMVVKEKTCGSART